MKYDLSLMVDKRATRRRKRRAIKLRSATSLHERELLSTLMRVVRFWGSRIRELEPPFVVRDAMPTPEQIAAEQEEANRLVQALIVELNEWVQKSGDWVRKMWIGRVKYEFGVDLELMATNQASAEMVRAAAEWAAALIQDLNDSTRNRLVGALAQSVSSGLEPDQISQIIKQVIDASESRAQLIARDQTQKIFSKLNEAQQIEAGIEEYVWNHSFQPNPRRHHVERQGNVYRWDSPPRDGHPGTAINCRCTTSAVV